jgi:hypothetical protein
VTSPASDYTWPTRLLFFRPPPRLIYLDLNHWIALAKANASHSQGALAKEALDACHAAVESGRAVFPLSDSIYFEVSKIGSRRQRRDLREVMERISRFYVVTSRSVVSVHEIETMLDGLVGPSRDPINKMAYLDWGVMRAFGVNGALQVFDRATGEDVTEQARTSHPGGPEEFDRIVREGDLKLNRSVLEGPTSDEEEAELRANAWNPLAAFAVAQRRAQQELEQAARFDADPAWRRGRIRDVISVREVAIELNDHLAKGLADRGVDFDAVFTSAEMTRAAWDAMPSFDVAVTIKTEYHRDPNHRWRTNDIADIDALGSALPYCDVVLTDKAVVSHARRTGLAERLGTTIMSSLDELRDVL